MNSRWKRQDSQCMFACCVEKRGPCGTTMLLMLVLTMMFQDTFLCVGRCDKCHQSVRTCTGYAVDLCRNEWHDCPQNKCSGYVKFIL
jgi:hypothetical protein